VKVEISFTVGPGGSPDHHEDARLRKTFEIDWAGRPLEGEVVELDIAHPLEEESFEFAGAYWSVNPSSDGTTAWFWLRRVVVDADNFGWEDGFPGYMHYAQKRGWDVFGGYGQLGRRPGSS
jgi:hypothetical protein